MAITRHSFSFQSYSISIISLSFFQLLQIRRLWSEWQSEEVAIPHWQYSFISLVAFFKGFLTLPNSSHKQSKFNWKTSGTYKDQLVVTRICHWPFKLWPIAKGYIVDWVQTFKHSGNSLRCWLIFQNQSSNKFGETISYYTLSWHVF